MSLSANRSRLAATTKELSLRWGETKNYWRDAKSREFERRYVEEADATQLVQLRAMAKDVGAKEGVKVTYLPFVMKAMVAETIDVSANSITSGPWTPRWRADWPATPR